MLSISLQYPALLSLQTEESSLLQQWGFQMELSVMCLEMSTQDVAMVSKSGIQQVHLSEGFSSLVVLQTSLLEKTGSCFSVLSRSYGDYNWRKRQRALCLEFE